MPLIENLDILPIPDRSLIDNLNDYAVPATISSSRGCPGKCVFCAAGVLSGGRYRLRSSINIVREFEYLRSLGFDTISVIDDTMTADLNRMDRILNDLIKCSLGVSWYCESRVDAVTKPILEPVPSTKWIQKPRPVV